MSAFFMLVFSSFKPLYALEAEACRLSPNSHTEKVLVKWVYDGDTLLVTDQQGNNKRKIRIIGIDTPEVKHHQQKAQRYGAKAREELRALLKKHNYQIILTFDNDKYDRYKRELAYTYLPDGRSISEWLLRRGYAKTLAIPPNVGHAACYKKAELYAQQQELRLWKLKSNRLKSPSDLKPRSKGYVRLKSKIIQFKQHKKSLVLELENKGEKSILLRIKKKNLHYFKTLQPKKLISQEVIVSGILKVKKGKRTMNLNHSSQLELVSIVSSHNKQVTPTIKWSTKK